MLKSELTIHRISGILLISVFLVYLGFWVNANSEKLLDPNFQNGDARQHLFFFHQFDSGALREDPVAQEFWLLSPPFFRLLYRILVPATGVLVASKIVQGLCYLILALAAMLLIRSRRAGLAAGLVAAFLFLHTDLVGHRIAGGLPRGFAFPALMLWFSGAVTSNWPARALAAFIAAATYPVSMLLVLAAEMAFQFVRFWRMPAQRQKQTASRLVLLIAGCALITATYIVSRLPAGSLPTYAEAKQDPVFGREGRITLVPLRNPIKQLVKPAINPYQYHLGGRPGPFIAATAEWRTAVAILALFLLLFLTRLSPFPTAAVALGCASLVLYTLSRLFAFQLFWPDRYAAFGIGSTTITLGITAIGLIGHRLGNPARATLRNVAAVLFVVVLCAAAGSGLVKRHQTKATGYRHATLYRFARALPLTARFAGHPKDGDDLPLFGARAMVITHETLNPVLDKTYGRLKIRAVDTLLALYSTRRQGVLDFCREYEITHLLLRPARYTTAFREEAKWVEPFSTMLMGHLAATSPGELVLRDPPSESIVFQNPVFTVVDVDLLARAWSE